MNLTVNEAVNSHQCLQRFGEKDLPISVAVKVSRNQKQLADIVQEFEKQRAKLLKDYGTKDDKGNVRIEGPKQEEFNTAMEALVEAEVEITETKISIEDLGEDFKVESNALMFIGWMFND